MTTRDLQDPAEENNEHLGESASQLLVENPAMAKPVVKKSEFKKSPTSTISAIDEASIINNIIENKPAANNELISLEAINKVEISNAPKEIEPSISEIILKELPKAASKKVKAKASAKEATSKKASVKEDIKLQVKNITAPKKAPAKSIISQVAPGQPKTVKGTKPLKTAIAKKVNAVEKIRKVPTASTEQLLSSGQSNGLRRIVFQVRFFTHQGQWLSVSGSHPLLGNNDPEKAFPLQFLDRDNWYGVFELPAGEVLDTPINYNYNLHDEHGSIINEWGVDKIIDSTIYKTEEILLIDSWNDSSYIENSFYTEPFKKVLLAENYTPVSINEPASYSHIFKIKAPLLQKGQVMCLLGSEPALKEWNQDDPIIMQRGRNDDQYSVKLDLSDISFPIVYKYGVYDVSGQKFVRYESGNNRIIFDSISPKKLTVVSDGFAYLPNNSFRGAGVAIPVFSLRSNNGYGVGEFNDIKLLVDWASQVGMKLIQILPVNDTTATHTNADSYPYAAISAFALHPIYLHIPAVIRNGDASVLQAIESEKLALQQQPQVNYKGVMDLKWNLLRQIFPAEKEETFDSDNFQSFFKSNQHWLVPYAAFCYLRDENNTADCSKWSSNSTYNLDAVNKLAGDPNTASEKVSIHYFIQYHLHLQLQAATSYAHANGIIVKGDIPIGIYRNSCDAWQQPELYNMEMQAGAPPDDFAIKGQNWGFPTYNWQRMQQDGFNWWKLRFAQMRYYFDAFRIDHILGFFRIWSIPMHAVEGVLGNFVPALPVHISEFLERRIAFEKQRFVQPYINDAIIYEVFGSDNETVKLEYLELRGNGQYAMKEVFKTQRNIEAHFAALESTAHNNFLKQGLFDLISNILLIEVDDSNGQQFHFRIAMEQTKSFAYLDHQTQQQLRELYVNYFFRRQNDFWEREAMQKLPELKRSTNMLICGEDLGMVPDCVPGVMKRLSILSLEIQRMPKDPNRSFFHPNDAPYLSVVTPSTHDMSTIRGWWEEDRSKTQQFYNLELGQWGEAPYFCEPWINKAIVLQHLHSPAMWSIFQLQDLMGANDKLRRENPNEERINIPADPKHYWRYRIHLSLEDLLEQEIFNTDLRGSIQMSGRL